MVEYKQGRENKVANALSRKYEKEEEQGEFKAISFPIATWINDLKATYSTDSHLSDLLNQLKDEKLDPLKYTLINGVLKYKGRTYIGDCLPLKEKILHMAHDSPVGSHASYEKNLPKD